MRISVFIGEINPAVQRTVMGSEAADKTPAEPAPAVAVMLDDLDGFRWADLFGNDHPVELELGTGKAGFLLHRARSHPERNFFGIEWANQYYKFAVDRMQRWAVPNVRLLRADAAHFVRVLCPRDSLSMLHVYHPDPWPKKRHHKRRLIQKPFVDAAVACLMHGGRWAVQTDHAAYFEQIRRELLGRPELAEIEFDDPDSGVEDGVIATNFEIKYRREQRTIYRIAVVRK